MSHPNSLICWCSMRFRAIRFRRIWSPLRPSKSISVISNQVAFWRFTPPTRISICVQSWPRPPRRLIEVHLLSRSCRMRSPRCVGVPSGRCCNPTDPLSRRRFRRLPLFRLFLTGNGCRPSQRSSLGPIAIRICWGFCARDLVQLRLAKSMCLQRRSEG